MNEVKVGHKIKERQKKVCELMLKRIECENPTNVKFVVGRTMGSNNWRKMHGIHLMRGDTDKLHRTIMKTYRGGRGLHKRKEEKIMKLARRC